MLIGRGWLQFWDAFAEESGAATDRYAEAERAGLAGTLDVAREFARVLARTREFIAARVPEFDAPDHIFGQVLLWSMGMSFERLGAVLLPWARAGTPTFHVSAGLAAQLALTDPGRVAWSDVVWPFPAFRVQLTDPELAPYVADPQGGRERGVAVQIARWVGREAYDHPEDLLRPVLAATTYAECAAAWAGLGRLLCPSDIDALVPGWDVTVLSRTGLTAAHGCREPSGSVADWYAERDPSTDTDNSSATWWWQRFAVNLALWLASRDASDRPVWTPSQKTQGKHRTWVIGQTTKIDRRVYDAAKAVAQGQPHSCPAVRFIVRGHRHTYLTGPRAAPIKVARYVAPYWKGPEDGVVRDRDYVVKEEKKP